MKTKISYKPKEVTNKELEKLYTDLIENTTFEEGDVVRLKGDAVGPNMVVTSKNVVKLGGNYQTPDYAELELKIGVCWFNKSVQNFTHASFGASNLIIITEDGKS